MKFASIFAIFAVASAQVADPTQFIAQVVRQTTVDGNIHRNVITQGVLTRQWSPHVVVPASFIHGIEREQLRVYLGTNRLQTSNDVRDVEYIHRHPNFNINQLDSNNIAVLRLSYSDLDTDDLQPRNLGELANVPAVACTIYGFEGMDHNQTLRTVPVLVTNQNCRAEGLFCTAFNVSGLSCNGFFGSPVICANQDYVSAIAHVDSTCQMPGIAVASFLNIAPFADWINEVSSAKVTAQISLLVMALGVVLGKFVL